MRVLVVGGGIGGLAAGLALARAGCDVAVYERAPSLEAVGAGLSLWPNATRALRALGALDALLPHAGPITRMRIADPRGRVLLDTRVRDRDAPALAVHRADLQRVLGDALRRAAGPGALRLGHPFAGLQLTERGARVRFAGGVEDEADVVVGADGLHSGVRSAVVGDGPPAYRGYTAWRGVGVRPSGAGAGVAVEAWGAGLRFGLLDAGDGHHHWYAHANRPEGCRPRGGGPGDPSGVALGARHKQELLGLFGGWFAAVREAIEATPDDGVLRNDVYDRPPRRGWTRGRVTVLGDAAHPTTPNMGQGACLALEDAVVLARCLAAGPTPERALARYERARFWRTASVTLRSRWIGELARLGRVDAARAALLAATPRAWFGWSMRDVHDHAAG